MVHHHVHPAARRLIFATSKAENLFNGSRLHPQHIEIPVHQRPGKPLHYEIVISDIADDLIYKISNIRRRHFNNLILHVFMLFAF